MKVEEWIKTWKGIFMGWETPENRYSAPLHRTYETSPLESHGEIIQHVTHFQYVIRGLVCTDDLMK